MAWKRRTPRKEKVCLRCGAKNNKRIDSKNEFNCQGKYRNHVFITPKKKVEKLRNVMSSFGNRKTA